MKPLFTSALLAILILTACAKGAPAPTTSAPSSRPPAQQLLARALEAFGGAERVDRLQTMAIDATAIRTLGDQQAEIRQRSYVQFPRSFRRELLLDGMTLISVVSPEGTFVLSPLGVLPLPEENRVELERNLARSPLSLLKGRRHETFTAIEDGEGEIDGRPVDYLQVLFVGDSNRLAVDRETGRALELTFSDRLIGAPEEQVQEVTIRYGDFQEVEGLVYPFHSEAKRGGEHLVTIRVDSLQVDLPLDPELFALPSEAAQSVPEPSQP